MDCSLPFPFKFLCVRQLFISKFSGSPLPGASGNTPEYYNLAVDDSDYEDSESGANEGMGPVFTNELLTQTCLDNVGSLSPDFSGVVFVAQPCAARGSDWDID